MPNGVYDSVILRVLTTDGKPSPNPPTPDLSQDFPSAVSHYTLTYVYGAINIAQL